MYIPLWLIIIVVIGVFLYYINKNKKATFKPFKVEIYPKWYQILADYKPDEIGSIPKDILSHIFVGNYKDQDTNFWKAIISFTILKNDKNSKLVFDDNFSHFHSKVNFGLPKYSYFPELSVTEGTDGYDLKIETDKSLKIATIPYNISDEVQLVGYTKGNRDIRSIRRDTQDYEDIKKIIEDKGWKIKELDGDSIFKDYTCLEHKYFAVYYKEI